MIQPTTKNKFIVAFAFLGLAIVNWWCYLVNTNSYIFYVSSR